MFSNVAHYKLGTAITAGIPRMVRQLLFHPLLQTLVPKAALPLHTTPWDSEKMKIAFDQMHVFNGILDKV